MSRAERRRAERASRKGQHEPKIPVVLLGDNIVATGLGQDYEAKPGCDLDPKVPGVHRWFVSAAWKTTVEVARTAFDPDALKFMDNENLLEIGIGCWDCEQLLGEPPNGVAADSVCPAGDEWTPHARPS